MESWGVIPINYYSWASMIHCVSTFASDVTSMIFFVFLFLNIIWQKSWWLLVSFTEFGLNKKELAIERQVTIGLLSVAIRRRNLREILNC